MPDYPLVLARTEKTDDGAQVLSPALYLAPIQGITDAPFRRIFAQHFPGFDGAVAPFLESSKKRTKSPCPLMPDVPQALTADPEVLIRVAWHVHLKGHTELNWNLGCPFPMVTRRGRGAALLAKPEHIDFVLGQAMPKLKTELSIKMRLGLSDPTDCHRVLEILRGYPIKRVIIHPRTAAQKYSGRADWDAFEECLTQTSHLEVMGNGDIKTLEKYRSLRDRFPNIHSWMVGRGALEDPFLPAMLKENKELPKEITRLQAFHEDLYQASKATLSGPSHLLGRMKSIWTYLSESFDPKEKVLKKVRKTKTLERYEGVTRDLFEGSLRKNA